MKKWQSSIPKRKFSKDVSLCSRPMLKDTSFGTESEWNAVGNISRAISSKETCHDLFYSIFLEISHLIHLHLYYLKMQWFAHYLRFWRLICFRSNLNWVLMSLWIDFSLICFFQIDSFRKCALWFFKFLIKLQSKQQWILGVKYKYRKMVDWKLIEIKNRIRINRKILRINFLRKK